MKKEKSFLLIGIIFVFVAICLVIIIKNNIINDNIKNNSNSIKNNKVDKQDNNISSDLNNGKSDTDVISEPAKTEKEENQKENENNITISIELIGKEEITINKGEKFNDPGAKATDSNGKDISNRINVDNAVDSTKEGTYTITYSIGNSIVMRYVIVK